MRCDSIGWRQWTICLTVSIFSNSCRGRDYCKHFATCYQRLEFKEHQCVKLEENRKVHHNDRTQCVKLIDMARTAVDGLQLREAELKKDCALRRRISGGIRSDTHIQKLRCEQTAQKLLSNESNASLINNFKIYESERRNSIKRCRKLAKSLRQQCHALARCCPLHSCSGLETIRSQISSANTFLKRIKDKCLNERKMANRIKYNATNHFYFLN